MTIRSTARGGALLLAGAVAAFAVASHAQPSERPPTTIAIRALDPTYGGEDYGGGGGGYVTERRDLEVGADGVVRLVGVAAGLDPATVEFRSLTGGDAVRVVEQRVTGNPLEPSALLAASVGKPVAITTAAGELAGTLRAVSDDALVVEGSDRALRIVPRGPQLLAVKLPAGNGDHAPALEWRLTGARPGRHAVEVSYRAEQVSWRPAYTAVLADDGSIELSSWATIINRTGADFVDARVALTAGGGDGVFATLGMVPGRPATTKPRTWQVATPVTLRHDQPVQVELAPKKLVAKPRTAIVFEALDPAAGVGNTSPSGCGDYAPENPRIGKYTELEVGAALPDGQVRIMRRTATGLAMVGEDRLRASPATGLVRIPVEAGGDLEVSGVRAVVDCVPGNSGRSLREDLSIEVSNDSATAVDVVIREYLFRWLTSKILRESEKGTKVDDRTREYRVRVPARGSKAITLSVQYDW